MAPDACICDPRHRQIGGYDRGCPRHDPAERVTLDAGAVDRTARQEASR